MTEDIYSAPEAEISAAAESASHRFYVVSPTKFTVLFFATLGIYQIYWFYRNWHCYKQYTGEKMLPVMRGLFAIFFVHNLFSKVDTELKEKEKPFEWRPGVLATVFVLLTIISSISDRLSVQGIAVTVTDFLAFFLLPVIYFVLLRGQKAINLSEDDPEGMANSALTPANWFWVVLGVALWALSIFGYLAAYGVIPVE